MTKPSNAYFDTGYTSPDAYHPKTPETDGNQREAEKDRDGNNKQEES